MLKKKPGLHNILIRSLIFIITVIALFFSLNGCSSSHKVVLSGTVEAVQSTIKSETSGRIVQMLKNEGDEIKKDDVIALLDSSIQELSVKQLDAAVKLKQLKLDEALANGRTELVQQAQLDLEQAKASLEQAQLQLSKCSIRSPWNGTVTLKISDTGDIVVPGSGICVVTDLSNLYVKLYIPQRYLNSVSQGQELALEASVLPGRKIRGTIESIASEAEYTPKNVQTDEARENTVFRIKVRLIDGLESLKPGMTVKASIPVGR